MRKNEAMAVTESDGKIHRGPLGLPSLSRRVGFWAVLVLGEGTIALSLIAKSHVIVLVALPAIAYFNCDLLAWMNARFVGDSRARRRASTLIDILLATALGLWALAAACIIWLGLSTGHWPV